MTVNDALNNFRRGHEAGRLAQAYVVIGPMRGGVSEFTENALAILFCEEKEKPCRNCPACRQIITHVHPDLMWIEPHKKSRIISVEQIKESSSRISQTSFGGSWKTCVLAGADRMSAEAANAFLKTLEEPPGKSIFFLMTDNANALLPTIRSRCQRIIISGISNILADNVRDAAFNILVSCASGSENTSNAGIVARLAHAEQFVRLMKDMKSEVEARELEIAEEETRDEDNATFDARVNARYREARLELMRLILQWHRDILLLTCGCNEFLHNNEHVQVLKQKAEKQTFVRAWHNVEIIEHMNEQLSRNLPESSVMSSGFSGLE